MNILLDYFFPITAITPTPAASTAFLKQVLVVVKPKVGVTPGTITLCTTSGQVAAITDNTEALQLFAAGMTRIYVLASDDLDLDAELLGHESDFYTIVISSDFTEANITGADFGAFKGVIGVSGTTEAWLEAQAAIENRSVFATNGTNKAKNMMYAFGKLLSNPLSWLNQQYITMPFADDTDNLGEANNWFDNKVSFVMDDTQFGKRLGLFAAGGKAITAPYITKNLEIDIQSRALQYISGNQPNYTKTQAALLEDELQKVVDAYIAKQWIELGTIEIKLEQQNFVASGYINISEPKALWRIFGEIRQTLT